MPDSLERCYEMRVNAAKNHADIYIYGMVGWDSDARGLIRELKEYGNLKTITAHINTIGGYIGDGLGILNTLRNHAAQVTTINEGYALSMGSVITQAGDVRQMASNALMMIHRAQGGAYGDASDMEKEAEILKKHEKVLIAEYARVTSKPSDEIQAMLDDETWFTAQEALETGLIDEIIGPVDIDASSNSIPDSHWQATASAAFNHAPTEFYQRVAQYKPRNGGLSMPDRPTGATHADSPKKTQDAAVAAPPEQTPAHPVDAEPVDAQAIARQAVAAENQRQTDIRKSFASMSQYMGDNAEPLLHQCLSDIDCTPEVANQRILNKMSELSPPQIGSHAVVVSDERDKFKTGVVAALSMRAGIGGKEAEVKEKSNHFRSYTLLELARAALRINGITSGGMSKMDVVAAAFTHTASDFSSLLANIAEKSMLMGYDEAEETFQQWTVRGEASDFKAVSRVDLNSFPSLDKVPDGAEYKYGTIGDRGETVQLATYGKLFSITRQAIINDDLGAFTRIPRKQGRAAIRTVGDLVYAVLTGNPLMSDAVALFHATHKNLASGAAASVINTASVDAMRVTMATQKDGGNNAAALNIRLANLIVPVALQGVARVVADSEFEVGGNNDKTTPNSVRGTFDVIADARLDANSAIAWYGSASPNQHDTVEVTYLDGQDQPYLEVQNGWTVDGAEFKVRIDAAVNPLDFRTLAKNNGA